MRTTTTKNVTAVELNPMKYYSLVELVKSIDASKVEQVTQLELKLEEFITLLDAASRKLTYDNARSFLTNLQDSRA